MSEREIGERPNHPVLFERLSAHEKELQKLADEVDESYEQIKSSLEELLTRLPDPLIKLFLLAPDTGKNAREMVIELRMVEKGIIQIIPNRAEDPTYWQICSPGSINPKTLEVKKNEVETPPLLNSLCSAAAWASIGSFEGHWSLRVYTHELDSDDTAYRRNRTGFV